MRRASHYLRGLTLIGVLAELVYLCCCALLVITMWFAAVVCLGSF